MNRNMGFTLIELTIVVAIIGILSVVGMGWYADNVISANRTDARAALTESSGSLEKCRSLYGSYNHANCSVTLPYNTDRNYYAVSGVVNSATFVLTATPVVGEPQASDADCTTLTLTNTGIEGATGANVADCW